MTIQQSYKHQTYDLAGERQAQKHSYIVAPQRARDSMSRRVTPTAEQQRRVLTGFVLGIFSLFAAFFPICGLPIAITAIVMGMSGRRVFALRTIATWGLAFSIIGLLLTFVNICIDISIYFSNYMFGR